MVFPGALAALAGAVGLLATRPSQIPLWAPACELGLMVVIIASTAALHGRYHRAPAQGFDERILRSLVSSNWIRVTARSAAAAIALWTCQRTFA